MAVPAAVPCPYCGSSNTQVFEDGSGRCANCGRAFRGGGPMGTLLVGEEVEDEARAKITREPIRIGVLGIVGGLLAFATIPSGFVVGAFVRGLPVETYVGEVFNTAFGAVVCLAILLLVVSGWVAMWAGFHVWRGVPERTTFLLLGGIAIAILSSAFGATGGALGIAGGGLAIVAAVLGRRKLVREGTEEAEGAEAVEGSEGAEGEEEAEG